MPKKVFVSYSRRNYDFTEKLVASLRTKGLEVWFDYQLLSGHDWDDSLEEQIRNCDVLIVVLSKPSVASDNVKNEVRFALDIGKSIHPILLEKCSVPLSMRRMHYVDFTKLDYEKAVERLVNDIQGTSSSESEAVPNIKDTKTPKTKYLILALTGLLLIAVLVWRYWPTSQTDGIENTLNSDNQEIVFKDDINWRKINTSNKVDDYVDYISKTGNSEGRLENAVESIQDMLKVEGGVIMKIDNGHNWFSRFVSKDNDGYVYNGDVPANNEAPTNGDLLLVKKRLNVINPKTFDVMGGVFLNPGDIVQYSKSTEDQTHTLWTFYYEPKNPTTK